MTTITQFTSQNTINEFAMKAFEIAITEGAFEILVTKIEDVVVAFELIDEGASVELTRENPMFDTVSNAIVDDSGVLRDLDISFYHRDLSRGNLETYCRAVLLDQFLDNRMALVERAIRTVNNIEARPADWKGDTRA